MADVVWATNSLMADAGVDGHHPQCYALLRPRGWTPVAYAEHLADRWSRHLLECLQGRRSAFRDG